MLGSSEPVEREQEQSCSDVEGGAEGDVPTRDRSPETGIVMQNIPAGVGDRPQTDRGRSP